MLLSGCFPFEGQDAKAKLMQDYKFPAATWGGVSEKAKAFVSTLLCAPPRLRPDTDRVLDHPWLTDPESLPRNYLRCEGGYVSGVDDPCSSFQLKILQLRFIIPSALERIVNLPATKSHQSPEEVDELDQTLPMALNLTPALPEIQVVNDASVPSSSHGQARARLTPIEEADPSTPVSAGSSQSAKKRSTPGSSEGNTSNSHRLPRDGPRGAGDDDYARFNRFKPLSEPPA